MSFHKLDDEAETASEECKEAVKPLLYLYFFGPVCDSRGVAHQLSSAQCVAVSTGMCAREWQIVESMQSLLGVHLPVCYNQAFLNVTIEHEELR